MCIQLKSNVSPIGRAVLAWAAAALIGSQTASADEPAYAPPANLPDFSYAGYGFGTGEIPLVEKKIIDVTDFGAQPGDNIDDSAAILSALEKANATAGPVVLYFPAGRFIVSEVLRIERSNIVIRGAGMGDGGTELYFPRPLTMTDRSDRQGELRTYLKQHNKRQREPERNIDQLFSEYSWSGGYIWVQHPETRHVRYLPELDTPDVTLARIIAGERGEQELQVEPGHTLRAGDVIQVQWKNKAGEDAPLIREIYGDTDLPVGSHHWTFPDRPLVAQSTRIIAASDERVVIGDPLLHPINASVPATIAQWTHLTHVGIEDLHLSFPNTPSFGHHLEQGYNGIFLTSAFDSWVRSVRVTNADSALISENSASVTVSHLQSEGFRMAHYAVYLGSVHNVLVADLVATNPTVHTFSVNTRCTRCVYLRATGTNQPTLDQHAGANHQNLFDQTTVHVSPSAGPEGAYYRLWDGSGAPYWQPGHGRMNTHWNTTVLVEGGVPRSEPVRLLGEAEGPDAYVIGVTGNRTFSVDYRPAPTLEFVNQQVPIPSLYEYQLDRRSEHKQ